AAASACRSGTDGSWARIRSRPASVWENQATSWTHPARKRGGTPAPSSITATGPRTPPASSFAPRTAAWVSSVVCTPPLWALPGAEPGGCARRVVPDHATRPRRDRGTQDAEGTQMIAQARITSDTTATVHLAEETVEVSGADLPEIRDRVKQT